MIYTEEQLQAMHRTELMAIIREIAKRVSQPPVAIVPNGARNSVIIDAILEDQEEKGGSR